MSASTCCRVGLPHVILLIFPRCLEPFCKEFPEELTEQTGRGAEDRKRNGKGPEKTVSGRIEEEKKKERGEKQRDINLNNKKGK